jgi:hypothetical protein
MTDATKRARVSTGAKSADAAWILIGALGIAGIAQAILSVWWERNWTPQP